MLFRLSVLSSAGEPNWPIPVHLRKEFRQLPALYAYPWALRCFRPSAGEPYLPIPVHLRKEFGGYRRCTHIQGRCDVSVPLQVNRIGPFRYTCARCSCSYRRCTHIHGRCDVSVPPQVNHICLFRYTCARCSCIHQPCARTWGGACPPANSQHYSSMTLT